MAETPELGLQRLGLDGDWGLVEFSQFGKEYSDLYAFFYGLKYDVADENGLSSGRVERAFTNYPWRGGWSSTDFFSEMRVTVPRRYRPRVQAIQYASPGHIDLAVIQDVAISVAATVLAITFAINRINKTYRNIQEGIKQRKLGDIDVKRAELELTRDQIAFVDTSVNELTEAMHLENEIEVIQALNPSKLATLKILLALFRRARVLAKLQQKGKLKMPPPSSRLDNGGGTTT